MTDKSKNPFLNAALAAKAAANNPRVPESKTNQVQQAIQKKQSKSSVKRGREDE